MDGKESLVDNETQVLGSKAYDVLPQERSGPISERRGVDLLTESGVGKSASPGPLLSEILLG